MQKSLGRVGLKENSRRAEKENKLMCFLCCRMKLFNIAISTRVIGCFYEGLKEEAKECKVRDKDFGRKAR